MAATAYNPAKSPGEMTAGEINKALDRLDKLDSQLTREFIEAGRGNERPSDWADKHDPLTERWRAMYRERMDLRNEAERRYGPGTPSRLPKGFGPIKGYNPAVSPEQYRLAQAVLSGTARETGMTERVAREIVEKTPARMRSEFMKENPDADTYLTRSGVTFFDKLSNTNSAYGAEKKFYKDTPLTFQHRSGSRMLVMTEDAGKPWWAWLYKEDYSKKRRENPDDSPRNWPVFTTFPDTAAGAKEAKAIALKLKINGVLNRCELEGGVNQEWVVRVQALQKGKAWGVIEGRKSNPLFGSLFGPSSSKASDRLGLERKTRAKARGLAKSTGLKTVSYKGHQIEETADGEWKVPEIDKGAFKKLTDAKEFVDYHKLGARATNPADKAASMFESFIGRPSEEIVEFIEKEHYHGNLAGLAPLIGLKIRTISGYDVTVEFNDVLLGSNEDGTHLYLIGGNQELNLDKIHVKTSRKDSVVIGEAWCIAYHAAKSFEDFKPTDFVHGFGPEKDQAKLPKSSDLWDDAEPPNEDVFGTGDLPTVRYDCMNCRIFLDGGSYHIDKPLFGVSAGIEG